MLLLETSPKLDVPSPLLRPVWPFLAVGLWGNPFPQHTRATVLALFYISFSLSLILTHSLTHAQLLLGASDLAFLKYAPKNITTLSHCLTL